MWGGVRFKAKKRTSEICSVTTARASPLSNSCLRLVTSLLLLRILHAHARTHTRNKPTHTHTCPLLVTRPSLASLTSLRAGLGGSAPSPCEQIQVKSRVRRAAPVSVLHAMHVHAQPSVAVVRACVLVVSRRGAIGKRIGAKMSGQRLAAEHRIGLQAHWRGGSGVAK